MVGTVSKQQLRILSRAARLAGFGGVLSRFPPPSVCSKGGSAPTPGTDIHTHTPSPARHARGTPSSSPPYVQNDMVNVIIYHAAQKACRRRRCCPCHFTFQCKLLRTKGAGRLGSISGGKLNSLSALPPSMSSSSCLMMRPRRGNTLRVAIVTSGNGAETIVICSCLLRFAATPRMTALNTFEGSVQRRGIEGLRNGPPQSLFLRYYMMPHFKEQLRHPTITRPGRVQI